MRSLAAALLLLPASLFVTTDARAEPYMWGIGPNVGTIVVPGRYPLAWPSKIQNYNFNDSNGPLAGDENSEDPNRDLDEDGNPRFTSLERVRDDLRVQLTGFYGIDKDNQIGGAAGFALGKRYTDLWVMATYDRVLISEKSFDVKAGLGLGFGNMRFAGDPEVGDNELLRVPYFPVRGRVMGLFRDKVRAYGLGLFVQSSVPSNMFYTDLDGKDQELGSPLNFALFVSAGLELEVQFGEFLKRSKKKGKGKGKKGGGKKKGGGGKKKGGGGKKKK